VGVAVAGEMGSHMMGPWIFSAEHVVGSLMKGKGWTAYARFRHGQCRPVTRDAIGMGTGVGIGKIICLGDSNGG